MRAVAALAACVAFANAQTFDMDMILAAEPVPTPSIPVVYITGDAPSTTASATTVSYVETQAAASVSLEVAAAASSTALAKRAVSTCVPQPTGISHNSSPDTASAFLADAYYSSVASAAPTPAGYVNTFTNLQASNNAYGYVFCHATVWNLDLVLMREQIHGLPAPEHLRHPALFAEMRQGQWMSFLQPLL